MRRTITIALIVLLTASSIVMVQATSAQSTSPLSVPQFTVTYLDKSYDVEPVYGVDQYTGQTVVKTAGYHVQNCSVVLKIANQPFTSYFINSSQVNLYYRIGVKGHYGSDWQEYASYPVSNGEYSTSVHYQQIDNQVNTVAIFGFTSNNGSRSFYGRNLDVDVGGEVDFRVQSYTAYFTQEKVSLVIPGWKEYNDVIQIAGTSGWSNIQTIKIGSGEVTNTQTTSSPPPSPIQPTPTSQPSEPTDNPTEAPLQPNTQSDVLLGVTWKYIALGVACITIVALAVTLVLVRRR
jgi:hypothetical protein